MSAVYPPFGGPPAQRCLRCGAPLPPNVITCSNCGTYNPVTQPGWSPDQGQSQWGRSPAPSSYDGSRYSGQQWGQAPLASPEKTWPQCWFNSLPSIAGAHPCWRCFRWVHLSQKPQSTEQCYKCDAYESDNSCFNATVQ